MVTALKLGLTGLAKKETILNDFKEELLSLVHPYAKYIDLDENEFHGILNQLK